MKNAVVTYKSIKCEVMLKKAGSEDYPSYHIQTTKSYLDLAKMDLNKKFILVLEQWNY